MPSINAPSGGTRRGVRGPARQPPPHPRSIRLIVSTKQARQRRLFIPHDEEVRGQKKQSCVAEQRERAIKERGAAEGQRRSDIHRIAHVPVGTLDYQLAGRIERRGGSATDQGKRQDAPQGQRPASHSHDNPGILNRAQLGWPSDPGSFQNPPRHEDEQQADKERRVGNGPG
jgi:hypothetical protein